MPEVLPPPPITPIREPVPRRRVLWFRLAVVLLLLLAVPVLALYGAHIRDERAAYELEVSAWLDGIEERFLHVPLLSAHEQALLRRSLNARHVALAQKLGIPPVTQRAALVSEARERGLVRVDQPSPYYTAGPARYSVPFLTPSAAASLDTLGTRFHALLDTLGLPRYRFVVTSVLRSTEDQAALQGHNVNAARGHSSHEYGTTYDVHYRRFTYGDAGLLSPPAPPERLPTFVRTWLRESAEAQIEEAFTRFAASYPSRLGALLGRVLIALEDEGVLVTVMERRQPVYHTTVSRALVETDGG